MAELNLVDEVPVKSDAPAIQLSGTVNLDERREEARGDLARGLLWLLTFAIGGVLAFVGLGRLDGSVITQSIFPSLVALAGTALGFYFGSQSAKASEAPSTGPSTAPQAPPPGPVAGSTGNASGGSGTAGLAEGR